MTSTRIALDVMGGDRAPAATLQGALQACASIQDSGVRPEDLLLVGPREAIAAGLVEAAASLGITAVPDLEVLHASQVIGMEESPSTALRAKPDSSISVGVDAVRRGEAGAFVSMGNTGAVVGAATLGLRTLEGIKRPGIAVTIALREKRLTLLDMGANIAPKPEHLLQYGLMGSVYIRDCFGVDRPRIGLLNIGEEASKGTDLFKAAHKLFTDSSLDFLGKADVVVTDGFTGNVVLKLLENFSAFMLQLVLDELKAHGVAWAPEALANLRRHIDYAEYGGALLLGVDGVVVIGHGRSDRNAVANALSLAARNLAAGVNRHIVKGAERHSREGAAN
jgi:glycerol-3-phosphate acyltransferase PlsX